MPLNDIGRQQARYLRAQFEALNVNFDLIYTSDLCRAAETCQIIVGADKPIQTDDRLRERAFGVIEGKTLDEYRAEARRAGHNEWNYSSFTPQGAEHMVEVNNRVRKFCQYLITVAKPGHHVLVR